MLHSLRYRLLLAMSIVVLVSVGTVGIVTSRSTTSAFTRYVERDFERTRTVMAELLDSYKQGQSPEQLQELAEKLSDAAGERIVVANPEGKVIADSGKELVGETLDVAPPPGAMVVRRDGPVGAGAGGTAMMPITDSVDYVPGIDAPLVEAAPMTGPVVVGGFVDVVPTMPVTSMVGISLAEGGMSFSADAPLQVFSAANRLTWTRAMLPLALLPAAEASTGGEPAGDLIVARLPGSRSGEVGFLSSVNQQLLLAVAAVGLAALLFTWLLSRRMLGPIEALTSAAGRMERGDLSQRVAVSSRDEIGELARAFNAMAGGLERLEQLRRGMVSDIAHELRTPLSNIRGYLEAMRDGVTRPDAALIASLHEEALLLTRLVDDLQQLELADAGQLKLVRQEVDLGDVIEQAAVASRPAATSKDVSITTEVEPDLPPADADRERVGQVLRNLLDNAIRHTPEGGSITVAARDTGGELEVSVRDTGPGIPPEHLPNIYERFYRSDSSRTRSTGGAGLGLSIARQLVELHGGRIRAESAEGEGSTFYFTLPKSPAAQPEREAQTTQAK
ncbi:MAG TPA: ATP-binding protein [Chloroflexia bacterium]|nr:ATP-binding protein [Chloroflexia bacterium]